MTPRERGLRLIPFAFALTTSGVAFLGFSTPGQRPALASPPPLPPRLLKAIKGPSCPLPVGQQVKAVRAFQEMIPVFRHPRCFNCHGGLDITDSTKHEGAEFVKAAELDPEAFLTAAERKEKHEACGVCHSNIKGSMTRQDNTVLDGWLMAPPPMRWVGKSDEKLCLDMKRFEAVPDSFVDHMATDHNEVQFIEAAFHGVRALSPKERTSNGIVPEPPPGNQRDLVAKARRWVQLVDGHWKEAPGTTEPSECGCVMPKIKLEVHHTAVMAVPKGLPSKEESDVKFQVNLEPAGDDKPGLFLGQHSLTRTIMMTLPAFCKGKASRGERWQFWALVDSVTGSLKVSHIAFDDEPTGGIECRNQRGTAKMGLFPGTAPTSDPGFRELVIPGDSGSSKTVTAGDKNWKESLTITVLEVPD